MNCRRNVAAVYQHCGAMGNFMKSVRIIRGRSHNIVQKNGGCAIFPALRKFLIDISISTAPCSTGMYQHCGVNGHFMKSVRIIRGRSHNSVHKNGGCAMFPALRTFSNEFSISTAPCGTGMYLSATRSKSSFYEKCANNSG